MTISRRVLLRGTVAAAAAVALQRAGATMLPSDTWPNAPVRVIVPFGAGGGSDVLTRLLAFKLQAKLGQNFNVENRIGGSGNLAMEVVRAAASDGYTIASATVGTLSINQFLYANMRYDPARDFAYVSMIWETANVFVVTAQHPARTLQEFLSWTQTRPNGVTYGSPGIGTTPHLSGELLRQRTGLAARHIAFLAASGSLPALMSGEVDFCIDNLTSYAGLLRAGKVRALAVTTEQRWPTLPEVPTMKEAGIPDFIVTSWGCFVMPKDTPAAIIDKLSITLRLIASEPATQQRFLDAGGRMVASTPQEAAAVAARERIKWRAVIRLAGVKPI